MRIDYLQAEIEGNGERPEGLPQAAQLMGWLVVRSTVMAELISCL